MWHIEQGAPWPAALQVDLITAIEKHLHAQTPSALRPICVLSLIYRTWSSIRTKEILKWLAQFSPAGLIGNRSRKETAHIWYSIAAMIERTWYDGSTLTGCISDIVKCYNCLPRPSFCHCQKNAIARANPSTLVPCHNRVRATVCNHRTVRTRTPVHDRFPRR